VRLGHYTHLPSHSFLHHTRNIAHHHLCGSPCQWSQTTCCYDKTIDSDRRVESPIKGFQPFFLFSLSWVSPVTGDDCGRKILTKQNKCLCPKLYLAIQNPSPLYGRLAAGRVKRREPGMETLGIEATSHRIRGSVHPRARPSESTLSYLRTAKADDRTRGNGLADGSRMVAMTARATQASLAVDAPAPSLRSRSRGDA
jgi:hypothetical protein